MKTNKQTRSQIGNVGIYIKDLPKILNRSKMEDTLDENTLDELQELKMNVEEQMLENKKMQYEVKYGDMWKKVNPRSMNKSKKN